MVKIKNRWIKSKVLGTIMVFFGVLCILLLIGLLFLKPQLGTNDEETVRNLFLQESKEGRENNLQQGYDVQIVGIQIEGNWAIVQITITNAATGDRVDGTVQVYRRILGRWFSSYNYPKIRSQWIDTIPDTLIPSASKRYLK